MFLRCERIIHRSLTRRAVRLALDGHAGEGYTLLVEGMCRICTLPDGDGPCGEMLLARYRRTLDEYADLYQVARE